MYELRAYQKKAVEKGLEFFNDPKRKGGDISVIPTAGGKSLVIACVAKELDGNTIVLQPSKEILEQNYQKMIDFGITDIGIYSASLNKKEIRKITFATIGSIINKKELFDSFDRVIIDECHKVNPKGGMYEEFINYLGGKVWGVTATPYRLHSFNDMKTGEPSVVAKFLTRTRPKLFQTISHITQVSELYDLDFLCPVEYIENTAYLHTDLQLNSTGMDFTEQSIRKMNEESNLVSLIQKGIEERDLKHTLVFTSFVSDAEALKRNLELSDISAEVLSAETKPKDRERILREFREGIIKVITNVGVLTTGFDFPELDCVILARPTQSVALYYQMVGRGLRVAEGKEKLLLIDMCGNVQKFGKVEDFKIVEDRPGMFRLKSKKSFLTGFCFVQNVDVENRGPLKGKDSNMITFGKYDGKHIKTVPTGYLTWCVENLSNKGWVDIMKQELKTRL